MCTVCVGTLSLPAWGDIASPALAHFAAWQPFAGRSHWANDQGWPGRVKRQGCRDGGTVFPHSGVLGQAS